MEPIITTLLTLIGALAGLIVGVHMARRHYGLTSRWEGLQTEIDFILRAMGFRR